MEKLGRYTILRELGKGSRGQVYLARDPVIERDVVLKTLRTDLAQNPDEEQELFERFRREAKALGTLKHPAIVTIYDVARDEETGIPYLAMEYVPGADLQSVTRSGMTLPVSQVADIGAQVAATLGFAHAHGIVHRDVKPSNLLLGVDGVVRIADFGIVKIQGFDITQIGLTLGTPSYMSPEQIRGDPVDGRCDVFALGVVLYELLTGEKPFGQGTAEEMVRRVFQEHPVAPMVRRARVPRDLSSFVMRCLEKDPADRWQLATELSEALHAVAVREKNEPTSDPIPVFPGLDAPPSPFLSTPSPPDAAEPVADAPLRPGDANLDAGTPLDAESLVADRELLRVEPIAGSPPPRASAGNRLISALLLVIALVGFALIVLRGRQGRLFGSHDPVFVHGVSERDLATPVPSPSPTPTPPRRTERIRKMIEMAKGDIAAGRLDDARAKLVSVDAMMPGDAEVKSLLDDIASRQGGGAP